MMSRTAWWLCLSVHLVIVPAVSKASEPPPRQSSQSQVVEPTFGSQASWGNRLIDTLLLRQHTTRIVVVNTALLGLAAGLIGSFAYLRKRALMGDALSHATLPGVVAAFLLTGSKGLVPLMLGAATTGILGVLTVIFIARYSRLKEDAAIGIVLSVFFAMGLTLLSVVQGLEGADAAGLKDFIYGRPASLTIADSRLIQIAAVIIILITVLLFKEFKSICFDQSFAAVIGRPVLLFDVLMMALVVLVTVIGLQAVGLILIVALLIVPPAAARFWTDNLNTMAVTASVFGVASGYFGACVSAMAPKVPTGAVIILVAGLLFAISMLVAPHRGVLSSLVRDMTLRRRVASQNV
ncbi:MAG: metal ABC transporter permease, partial [Phycisphaerae bacterium]